MMMCQRMSGSGVPAVPAAMAAPMHPGPPSAGFRFLHVATTNLGAKTNGAKPSMVPSGATPATDLDRLQDKLSAAKAAQEKYARFSQEQVDEVFKAAALAANQARVPLAKMAVKETGMGVIEDKVTKNHFASEFIYNKYKKTKTCGIIEEDHSAGVTKVAEPVGVVAGIVPTTNPTSTAIFKALLCLKTRNALVLCPHPRAKNSTTEAARIVRDAAIKAGAPEDIISWVENPSMPISQALMTSPEVSMILATGGPGMVRAAYSSGHPAVGVGAGNTPAVIDDGANVQMAVSSVLLSKAGVLPLATFDNGVICASEQSVVVVDKAYDAVRAEFERRGAYFLNEEEKEKVRKRIIVDGHLNAEVMGQSPQRLAEIFGITVPAWAKVLIGEVSREKEGWRDIPPALNRLGKCGWVTVIGDSEPFSKEKLCPVLGMYRARDFDAAVDMADQLINLYGAGHTSVLYTNPLNREHIQQFNRTVGLGDVYNFHLDPSLTLGCGSWGSTSVSANIGPFNLLNIKSGIERRENMLWFRVPPKGGCLEVALQELKTKKRAFIVTDKPLFDLGYVDQVTRILDSINVHHQVFYHVAPDPSMACIQEGLREIQDFKPDVIIALGGGSPMDAAKVMLLMYEMPDIEFEGLSMRFMDIRKRVYEVPDVRKNTRLICIPTTSGTGSEVTPFAVVTDEKTGQKYPLADYSLTPYMAIVDPQLVIDMPKGLTAYGGVDALVGGARGGVHALESYVSVFATDYTKGLSAQAAQLIFNFLPRAYADGPSDYEAREKVHSAATIAGMAFANAFLGICHSVRKALICVEPALWRGRREWGELAHKLGAQHHIPHGLANAALISHIIRYNATDRPLKQAAFPQYQFPKASWKGWWWVWGGWAIPACGCDWAKQRYAELADILNLGGATEEEKVIKLIEAVEDLKSKVGIPPTIRQIVGNDDEDREAYFRRTIPEMAENAFDDQCTGANPRYPLISDLEQIYEDAWTKPILPLTSLGQPEPKPPAPKKELVPALSSSD
eukprot:scaffold3.g6620.t1